MECKKQAGLSREYRKLVSEFIHVLTYQNKVSLLHLAYVLGLTPSQMSRVNTGVSSLSPERFLVLVGFVYEFLEYPDRKNDIMYIEFKSRLNACFTAAYKQALNISCDEYK